MSLFLELAGIFINIVMPVFVLVLLGALAGRTLELEARTMTRYAYYLLAPAFVLNIIGDANVSGALALRMIGYIVVVEVGCALLGYGVARLLGRSRKMIGAYILVGVFGNVGNFGLPIIEFRLGTEALVPATVYFLAVSTTSFIIGVAAAGGSQGGVLAGVKSVVRTPALVAIIPALLFNMSGGMPVALERIVNLLAGAMIPTMLATLGVQLGRMQDFHFRWDML
ncbi:MAG: AEC family transporter, partial [Caldilineae bacterium]